MKLIVEEEIISEHFLGLPVVLLDSFLTDNKVRRSGQYVMNETERASLTERQAAEIAACVAGDEK